MNSTNTTTTTDAWHLEDMIAASIVFVLSFGAVVITLGTVTLATIQSKMSKQFAWLNTSLTICDCGNLLVMALWTAPMTLTYVIVSGFQGNSRQNTALSSSFVGQKVGHFASLVWFGSQNMMLGMAINRYVAIARPMEYDKVDLTHLNQTFFSDL